jgi:DNA-binding CsgD family transcriptional regulator
VLRGRRRECAVLDRLLERVSTGRSGALVVRGEPGVGKTALLDNMVGRASDCRVAHAVGVQSEMELPFAGLHQLCAGMLDRFDRLPVSQRDALCVAFGLAEGPPPDRVRVGLAVLSLFGEVAEERPLVCVVDDAHWLDRASAEALAFVARRLVAESVCVVIAVRESGDRLAGLPELVVEGLGDGDARALLESVVTGPLDVGVRDRIVAETRGNPLALLELPRGLTPAELAGGFGLLDAPALSGRIEESFRRRLAPLPADVRRLLLIAAAEPVGDPVPVWRAAARLGVGLEAAAPGATAGLLELSAHEVRFRHPLVRSAVYQAASPEERRSVHQALAEATDPEADPDRRAWHRAHAAAGPDEDVAGELERSAGRAQARGGMAAAAAFLERAAGLTLDPAHRVERALAAAQAKHRAGAPDAALALLAMAKAGPLDELQRAQVDLLSAQLAFAVSRGSDAPPLLLEAAKGLEPLDAGLARATYLDALTAAMFVGPLAGERGVLQIAEAAGAAPRASDPPGATDLLLEGWVLLMKEGYAAATPTLRSALDAVRKEEGFRSLWLACRVAMDLWDHETWDALSAREVHHARAAGALTELPFALGLRAGIHLFEGDLPATKAMVEESLAVSAAIATPGVPYLRLFLAAFQGCEAEVAELTEATVREVMPRGEGIGLTITQWTRAVLYNGVGRYEEALAVAEQAAEQAMALLFTNWGLPELIEAAARSGQPERGAGALERLSEATRASGTEWALGIGARSRALLSEHDTAEELYREAIDRLGRTRIRVELARSHLLYGEWLRRERRRLDAREQLRTAQEMLTSMGLGAFAQRAARELLATGETAVKRTHETRERLTAQEAQIARLASEGLSNSEIGVRLFISSRTVEYHMHKVFAKLNVHSRHQLDRALSEDPGASQPA